MKRFLIIGTIVAGGIGWLIGVHAYFDPPPDSPESCWRERLRANIDNPKFDALRAREQCERIYSR